MKHNPRTKNNVPSLTLKNTYNTSNISDIQAQQMYLNHYYQKNITACADA